MTDSAKYADILLPDDPAALKAIIADLELSNAALREVSVSYTHLCTTALVEYSQEYWSLIGPQTTQIYLSSGAKLIEHRCV